MKILVNLDERTASAPRGERRPAPMIRVARMRSPEIIGARRACTVSMISPLSMPCR
jgi:hypothetical protein